MNAIRIVDVTDEASFGLIPPCADPGFDHRSCDYWEDADRGSKAARSAWLEPRPKPEPTPTPSTGNPFLDDLAEAAYNPFAPGGSNASASNPFASGASDALADNPFAPKRKERPRIGADAPPKLALLAGGLAVFGTYAKILLADDRTGPTRAIRLHGHPAQAVARGPSDRDGESPGERFVPDPHRPGPARSGPGDSRRARSPDRPDGRRRYCPRPRPRLTRVEFRHGTLHRSSDWQLRVRQHRPTRAPAVRRGISRLPRFIRRGGVPAGRRGEGENQRVHRRPPGRHRLAGRRGAARPPRKPPPARNSAGFFV